MNGTDTQQQTPPADLFADDAPRGFEQEPDLEERRIARREEAGLTPTSGATQTTELRMLVEIAQGHERDTDTLLRGARRIGEALARADRALYSFPAGGQRIEGPTVGLAEALAQEYRYLWTGVRIDRVEETTVYLTAVVFDALAGSFVSRPHVATLPPPPGKFAQKADQAARWESMQVQSAISKAIRTAILHALPAWYVAEAVDAARRWLRDNELKGVDVPTATQQAIAHYQSLGVSVGQLAHRMGADPALWTASDIVELRRLAKRIKAGEATVQGEFGSPPPSGGNGKPGARESIGLPPKAAPAPEPARQTAETAPPPAPPSPEGPDPAALKKRARELESTFTDAEIHGFRAACKIDYQGDIRSSRLRADTVADYVAYLEAVQQPHDDGGDQDAPPQPPPTDMP